MTPSLDAPSSFWREYKSACRSTDLTERITVLSKYGVICQQCGWLLEHPVGHPRFCNSCENPQHSAHSNGGSLTNHVQVITDDELEKELR